MAVEAGLVTIRDESLGVSGKGASGFIAPHSRKSRLITPILSYRFLPGVVGILAALTGLAIPATVAQDISHEDSAKATIQGRVLDSEANPVDDALVQLRQVNGPSDLETKTNAAGVFVLSALKPGSYLIWAEKGGMRSRTATVVASPRGAEKQVELVLVDSVGAHTAPSASLPASDTTMEFADKASFTVAGVMDWTGAGGHGSDTSLRTSEALTRETLTLKPKNAGQSKPDSTTDANGANEAERKLSDALALAPANFIANRQLGEFYLNAGRYRESIERLQVAYRIDPSNRENEYELVLALKEAGDGTEAREHLQKLLAHGENGDLHRVAGELAESSGDPLTAVHEYEQAVRLDPSEQNYFEWGSELLLHRAVLQAQDVLGRGAKAHPQSARILTALATALFAGARYDEAALRLCQASDLSPEDPEPYLFMGKIQIASPNPLACVEQKLARFVEEQPGNSLANFYYAMAIWKGLAQTQDEPTLQRVEKLLLRSVTLDDKCADGYLQLGILAYSRHEWEKAIGYYTKSIEANSLSADAHFRLAVAYDRIGESAKARQQFQLHDEIRKRQAADAELQRREVKQFVVSGQPIYPKPQ